MPTVLAASSAQSASRGRRRAPQHCGHGRGRGAHPYPCSSRSPRACPQGPRGDAFHPCQAAGLSRALGASSPGARPRAVAGASTWAVRRVGSHPAGCWTSLSVPLGLSHHTQGQGTRGSAGRTSAGHHVPSGPQPLVHAIGRAPCVLCVVITDATCARCAWPASHPRLPAHLQDRNVTSCPVVLRSVDDRQLRPAGRGEVTGGVS